MRAVFDEEFAAARAAGSRTSIAFGMPAGFINAPPAAVALNVVAQKQPDRFTIPALIPMGELAVEAARALAGAAERFGDGIVHLTPDQNVELHDVRGAQVEAALTALDALGVRTRGRGGITDVLSCVG